MKSILAFSITIVMTIVFSRAQAFTLNSSTNSNLKGWENAEVSFRINTSNCPAGVDVVAAFNEAAKMWNGVATSRLKVSYGGTTTSTTLASPPTVYCETNFQAVTSLDQDFVVGAGAITSSNNRPATGLLILNVSSGLGNIASADPTELKIIMAHEIGHVIGLGHADESSALMYFDASKKKTPGLSQDDIDGITYLYPRDELSGDPMMGCGLVAGASSIPPSASGILASFALVFAAWFALRRRPSLHSVDGVASLGV
ncbi:MAG: matrixin family metalloprotease [Bdellovibrionota bacterium]